MFEADLKASQLHTDVSALQDPLTDELVEHQLYLTSKVPSSSDSKEIWPLPWYDAACWASGRTSTVECYKWTGSDTDRHAEISSERQCTFFTKIRTIRNWCSKTTWKSYDIQCPEWWGRKQQSTWAQTIVTLTWLHAWNPGSCQGMVSLKSYPTDSLHCIKYGGKTSWVIRVTFSIPHGSILGQVLFILYTDSRPSLKFGIKLHVLADNQQHNSTCTVISATCCHQWTAWTHKNSASLQPATVCQPTGWNIMPKRASWCAPALHKTLAWPWKQRYYCSEKWIDYSNAISANVLRTTIHTLHWVPMLTPSHHWYTKVRCTSSMTNCIGRMCHNASPSNCAQRYLSACSAQLGTVVPLWALCQSRT